jgi:hypothetical protein
MNLEKEKKNEKEKNAREIAKNPLSFALMIDDSLQRHASRSSSKTIRLTFSFDSLII